jgi:hypothetical protein
MAAKKPTMKNGGRATVRDVLAAVLGLNERIDGVHERIDANVAGQQGLLHQMTELGTSMNKLEKTTNARLHEMEADIITLKRPWTILAGGWSKALALGGFAAALSGTIVRLELWRFIPGL